MMINGVVYRVSTPYFAGSDGQAGGALPALPGSPLIPKPAETMMLKGSVLQVSTPYFDGKAAEKDFTSKE